MLRKPLPYFIASAVLVVVAAIYWMAVPRPAPSEVDLRSSTLLSREQAKVEQWAKVIAADPSKIWQATEYPFYLLDGNEVVAWSDNFYEPELAWFSDSTAAAGQPRIVRSLRGAFAAQTWSLPTGQKLLGLVPLFERYRITNRYLAPALNEKVFPRLRTTEIVMGDGDPVQLKPRDGDVLRPWWQGWYLALAGTLALAGALLVVIRLHRAQRFLWALIVLSGALVGVRLAMIFGGFPAAWIHAAPFDPTAFASSAVNATIFDLFLNSFVVVAICAYWMVSYSRLPFIKRWLRRTRSMRLVGASLALTIAFFGFLFPFLYFESIFHNSSITLDWTQSLFFDGPRILAFASVILGSLASFLFCHTWISCARALVGSRGVTRFLLALTGAAVLFSSYYLATDRHYFIPLSVGSLYFTVLYFTGWSRGLRRTTFKTFLYLTCATVCFGVQASFCNQRFTDERTAEFQYRFGSNFLVERDVLGEYLLNEGTARIASDPFIQTGITNPFISKGTLRQKIRQMHLSSYFNRYDVQIHLYSAIGDPLDNLSRSDLTTFVDQYKNDTGQTSYRGIFFVNRADVSSAKRYVVITRIARQGRTAGFVALELSLKKIVPESVYPELLVDNRFAENFKATEYSYAIFQNDTIVSSFGTFPYESQMTPDRLRSIPVGPEGVVANGYRHILIEGETGYKALITAKSYPTFYYLSNVSFWCLLGIGVITVGLLVRMAINFRQLLVLNYATRIQLYVFLAFMIPLVAVSVTTLYWTSQSAEEDLKSEFSDKARKIADQLTPYLTQYLAKETDIAPLQQSLIETARLSGVDATIYSPKGHLVATNQVQIFDNLILSNLINPEAMRRIFNKSTAFILEETIGKLQYNNSYRLLRSESTGEVLGVLSIPFFNSGDSLDRSRIVILSNVLIVFMIIFILFTVLSFVVTRWFTFPLRMITKSLSTTTLKNENQPLNWQSDDEIGWMVQEYNRMVRNLEKSKVELARNQKENAWREMAQQVAHEIKNPLTPMKLTLQQMQMLLREGTMEKERAGAAVKNLLTQLDILNEIATSFSSFARMPAPILHRTDLYTLVEKTVALYNMHPLGEVTLRSARGNFFVMGDDQLLSRVFSNLILNALQSAGETGDIRVEVSIEIDGDKVVVSFRDNGPGIDESLRDKVFMPHFTTKKSGSGLGLAISRQGVEQSGGAIWFETSNNGTTFFIAFPVVP